MDQRSAAFLEIMIAIAVIGILAFLIFLISRYARRAQGSAAEGAPAPAYTPQWYEFVLAGAVVVIAVLLLFWQFPPGTIPGAAPTEWQTDARSLTFFIVMAVIAAALLIVFLIAVFWRIAQQRSAFQPQTAAAAAAPTQDDSPAPATPSASFETPSATRLLGLVGLGAAFLILNSAWVPKADQYALMVNLIYPAGFVVALVMLFDKASRAWNVKGPGETIREWIYCDAVVFLFILSYLNLVQSGAGEKYEAMIWDFLNVFAFLFVFWMLDRKVTRYRFLVLHLYLIALPILLLIWRFAQGVEVPPEISWWSTIWPFFGLAIIFCVLEIIILIASRDSQSQAAGTAKDIIFMVLYAILLIASIPEAAA